MVNWCIIFTYLELLGNGRCSVLRGMRPLEHCSLCVLCILKHIEKINGLDFLIDDIAQQVVVHCCCLRLQIFALMLRTGNIADGKINKLLVPSLTRLLSLTPE